MKRISYKVALICISAALFYKPAKIEAKDIFDLFKPEVGLEENRERDETSAKKMLSEIRKDPKRKKEFLAQCVNLFIDFIPLRCRQETNTLDNSHCDGKLKMTEVTKICNGALDGKPISIDGSGRAIYGP